MHPLPPGRKVRCRSKQQAVWLATEERSREPFATVPSSLTPRVLGYRRCRFPGNHDHNLLSQAPLPHSGPWLWKAPFCEDGPRAWGWLPRVQTCAPDSPRTASLSDSLGSGIILSILSRTQSACPSHHTCTLGGFSFFLFFSILCTSFCHKSSETIFFKVKPISATGGWGTLISRGGEVGAEEERGRRGT